ncbi:8296_t:CDS:10 [Ambispora leptoticha]|uniref:8296_t:CDS:1 n=1 Tax=Ambispora leptoticha TaxID=144679 RepID=A0A9N9GH89_9GLOM|nr:8296_t:CDS:10 [Ambispora leptoticha]
MNKNPEANKSKKTIIIALILGVLIILGIQTTNSSLQSAQNSAIQQLKNKLPQIQGTNSQQQQTLNNIYGQIIQSQPNQQAITDYQTKKEEQLNLLSEVNNLLEEDDKPIFILIASNHPIIGKVQLQVGKKYDFLGKKIVQTIKEESEVYIFYEPEEFILDLEEVKSETPTHEKTCPVCKKACKECQRKPEEPESTEEPDYHATLKPESEPNADTVAMIRCEKCRPKHTIPSQNTFLHGNRNAQSFVFNQMAENTRRMSSFGVFNQPAEQKEIIEKGEKRVSSQEDNEEKKEKVLNCPSCSATFTEGKGANCLSNCSAKELEEEHEEITKKMIDDCLPDRRIEVNHPPTPISKNSSKKNFLHAITHEVGHITDYDNQFTTEERRIIKVSPKKTLAIFTYGMKERSGGNNLTQQEIADYLLKEKGLEVSQQAVSRTLKKYNITNKKITYHYANQLKYAKEIKSFKSMIEPLLLTSSVLALDECGFHLNEAPRRSYATKGYRASYHCWDEKIIEYSPYGSRLIPSNLFAKEQLEIKNSPEFYQKAPFLTIAKELLKLIRENKAKQIIFLSAYDKRKFPNGDPRKKQIFKETFAEGIPNVIVCAPHYPTVENQHHEKVLLIKTSISDLKKEDFVVNKGKEKVTEIDNFLSDCCQVIIKEYHVLSNKDIIQANYSCPKCGKYIKIYPSQEKAKEMDEQEKEEALVKY